MRDRKMCPIWEYFTGKLHSFIFHLKMLSAVADLLVICLDRNVIKSICCLSIAGSAFNLGHRDCDVSFLAYRSWTERRGERKAYCCASAWVACWHLLWKMPPYCCCNRKGTHGSCQIWFSEPKPELPYRYMRSVLGGTAERLWLTWSRGSGSLICSLCGYVYNT